MDWQIILLTHVKERFIQLFSLFLSHFSYFQSDHVVIFHGLFFLCVCKVIGIHRIPLLAVMKRYLSGIINKYENMKKS